MNKLEKALIITGIAISSLIPLKSQAQEANEEEVPRISGYGLFGGSIKNFNNSSINETLRTTFGIKGGIGLNISKINRIEAELDLNFSKNKKEEMELFVINGGVYFDFVLKTSENIGFYGGVGLKGTELTQTKYNKDQKEEIVSGGIGYGIRVGIEGQIKDNSKLYLEFVYDNINKTTSNNIKDLSNLALNFGVRQKF